MSGGSIAAAAVVESCSRVPNTHVAVLQWYSCCSKPVCSSPADNNNCFVARMQVAKLREKWVGTAFARAGDDIAARALAVEAKQLAGAHKKALDNAAAIRLNMKESAEYKEVERLKQLHKEEVFLDQMKAELEAEAAHAIHLKELERIEISARMADNEVVKLERAAAKKKAVEDEKRRQLEYFNQEEAAVQAHKDKYKHVSQAATMARDTVVTSEPASVCCHASALYRYLLGVCTMLMRVRACVSDKPFPFH